MMIFAGLAYAAEAFAQSDGGGGAGTTGGFFGAQNQSFMFMMIAMLAIFYFLLIRPQQKRQKEHKQMLSNLQKGDTIFTAGGLRGKVTGLDENVVTMEVADKVRVKVNRNAVGGLVSKSEPAPEAKES